MINSKVLSLLGILLATILVTTGCAPKTKIKAVKAGKVTDAAIKNIGVTPFENDNIGQSNSIHSILSNVKFDDKQFFNVIDRENIASIMEEKYMNDSGLVELVKENQNHGLEQMTAMVTGTVEVDSKSQSKFVETRTDYSTCVKVAYDDGNKYCAAYKKYNVDCLKNTYHVQSMVKVLKIANAENIYSQSYTADHSLKHCEDDSVVLPEKKVMNSKLATNIAENFAKDLAPSYVHFEVTILDSVDIDLTDKQSNLFESAVSLIEKQRVNKANELLLKINNETQGSSYVVLYNLAMTQEAKGRLNEALQNYKKAENIMIENGEDVDEISHAITRVAENLKEKQKAEKQKAEKQNRV